MFKDFVTLFTGMQVATSIMLIVGIILCIVKIFQPGQSVFGFLGGTFLILGVFIRMINGGTWSHLFWLTFILFTILITSYLISVVTNRSSWFVKMKQEDEKMLVYDLKPDIPSMIDLSGLKNKTCVAVTDFLPNGTIKIESCYYTAIGGNEHISKNTKLIITNVENNKIYVEKVKGEKR